MAVPCASTYPMLDGRTPASANDMLSTASWPLTLGAKKPSLPWPSLLTADPRMTAWIVSRSAIASASLLRTTTPQPWPKTVPLALASNVRT